MVIKKARPADAPGVLELIHECISDMNAQGIDQWNDRYPKDALFISDIENGTLYATKDKGRIVGIIVLNDEQDHQYEAIGWKDAEGRFLLVHRMAVHPRWQKRGVATELMDFAEEFGRRNGYTSIRLDTYSKNPKTLRFLEKRGYERKEGVIFFPETDSPYFCYEIIL